MAVHPAEAGGLISPWACLAPIKVTKDRLIRYRLPFRTNILNNKKKYFLFKNEIGWFGSLQVSPFENKKNSNLTRAAQSEPTPRAREKSSLEPPKKRIKKEKMSKAQNGSSSKTRSSEANGNHKVAVKLSKRDQVRNYTNFSDFVKFNLIFRNWFV